MMRVLIHFYQNAEVYTVILSWVTIPLGFFSLIYFLQKYYQIFWQVNVAVAPITSATFPVEVSNAIEPVPEPATQSDADVSASAKPTNEETEEHGADRPVS